MSRWEYEALQHDIWPEIMPFMGEFGPLRQPKVSPEDPRSGAFRCAFGLSEAALAESDELTRQKFKTLVRSINAQRFAPQLTRKGVRAHIYTDSLGIFDDGLSSAMRE